MSNPEEGPPKGCQGAAHDSWLYSKFSKVYDAVFERFYLPRLGYAVGRMKIAPGDRVLDLGVGTGLSLPLYPAHCKVSAVDLSPEMLEVCRRRVEAEGLKNVSLMQGDAENLEFPDDSFDHALAGFFITVVKDPRKVMDEINRVVKPGGTVVLVNHFRSDNKIVGQLEDAVCPVCRRLGWYSDVRFEDVFYNGHFDVTSRKKLRHLDLWDIAIAVNQ